MDTAALLMRHAQGFDNKMFGIAEAEAQAMDPHQRILCLGVNV